MTNLVAILASIVTSLSTNVTTTDNAVYEKVPNACDCPKGYGHRFSDGKWGTFAIPAIYIDHGYHNGAVITPATEKTETEIVTHQFWIEIGCAQIHQEFYDGNVTHAVPPKVIRELISEKEISHVSRTYKLDQQWTLSETKTNPPPPSVNVHWSDWRIYTNSLFMTNEVKFGSMTNWNIELGTNLIWTVTNDQAVGLFLWNWRYARSDRP